MCIVEERPDFSERTVKIKISFPFHLSLDPLNSIQELLLRASAFRQEEGNCGYDNPHLHQENS